MIGFTSIHKILISSHPVDMRKSFDGLCGSVESLFGADPASGHLFVFFNRPRTTVKMLLWDRSGFWIFSKRLEAGRYSLNSLDDICEIDIARLFCILDGIELSGSYNRKRFNVTS